MYIQYQNCNFSYKVASLIWVTLEPHTCFSILESVNSDRGLFDDRNCQRQESVVKYLTCSIWITWTQLPCSYSCLVSGLYTHSTIGITISWRLPTLTPILQKFFIKWKNYWWSNCLIGLRIKARRSRDLGWLDPGRLIICSMTWPYGYRLDLSVTGLGHKFKVHDTYCPSTYLW